MPLMTTRYDDLRQAVWDQGGRWTIERIHRDHTRPADDRWVARRYLKDLLEDGVLVAADEPDTYVPSRLTPDHAAERLGILPEHRATFLHLVHLMTTTDEPDAHETTVAHYRRADASRFPTSLAGQAAAAEGMAAAHDFKELDRP